MDRAVQLLFNGASTRRAARLARHSLRAYLGITTRRRVNCPPPPLQAVA